MWWARDSFFCFRWLERRLPGGENEVGSLSQDAWHDAPPVIVAAPESCPLRGFTPIKYFFLASSFPSSLYFPYLFSPAPVFLRQETPSKMSTIARSLRPFASRVLLSQRPSLCSRVTPNFRFPRGSIRSFSQSPFSKKTQSK